MAYSYFCSQTAGGYQKGYRPAAVAIAVAFQWIFNFIVSSTFVPLYNMSMGDMGDKFGHCFVYAMYGVICIVAAIFVYRLVPETKGKTLEDMTKLWSKKGGNSLLYDESIERMGLK